MNSSYENLKLIKSCGGTVRVFMGQWMSASVLEIDMPLSGDYLTAKLQIHGDPAAITMAKNAYIVHSLFNEKPATWHMFGRSDWILSSIYNNFMVSPNVERWEISLTLVADKQ